MPEDNLLRQIALLPYNYYKTKDSMSSLVSTLHESQPLTNINEKQLAKELKKHKNSVSYWVKYSEDKRTDRGWFLHTDKKTCPYCLFDKYIVGYFHSELGIVNVKEFTDLIHACTYFIKKEIDDILHPKS